MFMSLLPKPSLFPCVPSPPPGAWTSHLSLHPAIGFCHFYWYNHSPIKESDFSISSSPTSPGSSTIWRSGLVVGIMSPWGWALTDLLLSCLEASFLLSTFGSIYLPVSASPQAITGTVSTCSCTGFFMWILYQACIKFMLQWQTLY